MKVYVVHDDTCGSAWGIEETLLGVYSTKEKAIARIDSNTKERNTTYDYEDNIVEVELDEDVFKLLGWYTEYYEE